MNKMWMLALLCTVLSSSACGFLTQDCTLMSCTDVITINLHNAEGMIAGVLTVNGQSYDINTTNCRSRPAACVEGGAIVFYMDVANYQLTDVVVTIDVTATSNGVTRRAAQSVRLEEIKHYPNGEDCGGVCTNRRGSVTLQ